MKNKGFTLIEILSTIVVIGIISVITVPTVLGVIKKARMAAYKDSAYGYIEAAKVYLASHIDEVTEEEEIYFICDGESCKYKNEELSFKGNTPKSGLITIKGNGETTIENLYNGRYYANKEPGEEVVVSEEATEVLSRDELTKLVYELKNEVNELKNTKANQVDLEAVSSIAQQAQETGKNHATKEELEVVAGVASNAQTLANSAATQSSLEAVSTIANNNKETLKTMATKENLETVSSVAKQAQDGVSSLTTKHNSDVSTINGKISTNASGIATNRTNISTNTASISNINTSINNLGKTYATKTELESVSSIAKNAETLAKAAATQSSLESVSSIAKNAETLAKAAATQSSLEAVSSVAKAAQDAVASKVTKAEALNATYPVGSIYVTTVYDTAAKVANALGGTWEAYGAGRTLVGANGTTYTLGSTGGSSSVTLAVGNLPSHTHSIPSLSGTAASGGAHTHAFDSGGVAMVVYANSDYVALPRDSGFVSSIDSWWSGVKKNISSISSAGAHTHSVTTTASTSGSTGSGTAFSVQNPYVVVYMWKRTK